MDVVKNFKRKTLKKKKSFTNFMGNRKKKTAQYFLILAQNTKNPFHFLKQIFMLICPHKYCKSK